MRGDLEIPGHGRGVVVTTNCYLARSVADDIGVKDHLYVALLTFTLWFISCTVLAISRVQPVV